MPKYVIERVVPGAVPPGLPRPSDSRRRVDGGRRRGRGDVHGREVDDRT